MKPMERHNVEQSIQDVIQILDAAPMHRDMVPDANFVQLANRIPIAHLAIERGLKSLIAYAGAKRRRTHSLHELYQVLKGCDAVAAAHLNSAFEDVVGFFDYDTDLKDLCHLRSIDMYLSTTGHAAAFNVLRYWALGETSKDETPIPYISPLIHRELLCALVSLMRLGPNETVSQRVENTIHDAMYREERMVCTADDDDKKRTINWYRNWLFREHDSRVSALQEAVSLKFNVSKDDFIQQILQDAYAELQRSNDPAVRYFIHKLSYLPVGSQRRYSDAVPEVGWLNDNRTNGTVSTPGGYTLGYVERYAEGGWGIKPSESGTVRVTEVAHDLADAKHYLVNRLTHQVEVVVNGKPETLRIVGEERYLFSSPSDSSWSGDYDDEDQTNEYKLEFWDNRHRIVGGDQIVVKRRLRECPKKFYIVEGTVRSVDAQRVSIEGWRYLDWDD